MWTEWSRALGSVNLCPGQLQEVCAQWFHLSPLTPLWREYVLPLLCSLSTTACCDMCETVHLGDVTNVPFGITGLWAKKSCVRVLQRSAWFGSRWEVRTLPMETINFHIWVAISLNQIISDQKDVLWWAWNPSLFPTADLLLDTQHNCSFWPSCPHGTTHAQHWLVLLSLFLQEEKEQPS